jgi:hypothetical protein
MIHLLAKDAAEIAGTVELRLGESRANMPVGTILSMIDQQAQAMSASHLSLLSSAFRQAKARSVSAAARRSMIGLSNPSSWA